MAKVMTAKEAIAAYFYDGATVTFGGFANGLMHPEEIMTALEESYINRLCGRNRDGADKEALYEEFMTLAHVVVELCR